MTRETGVFKIIVSHQTVESKHSTESLRSEERLMLIVQG